MTLRFVVLLGLVLAALPAFAGGGAMIELGSAGIDGVVVRWIGTDSAGASQPDSYRVAVAAEAMHLTGVPALPASILPLEAVVSYSASGEVELTRLRATLLRANLLTFLPVDLVTAYRDLDRGIQGGVDFFSLRVPIRLTDGGEIVVLPGLEMGLRGYDSLTDVNFHTSFVVEARAAMSLVQDWLSTGILARVRYDLVTGGHSGDEEAALGFLALSLDDNQRMQIKVYAGIQHDGARDDLGLPSLNAVFGAGFNGRFGR